MKVRTLIRQLAMHDMDAQVWLAMQPQVETKQSPRYIKLFKAMKARPFHKGRMFLLAGSAAHVSDLASSVSKEDEVDYTKYGPVTHPVAKAFMPRVAGPAANKAVDPASVGSTKHEIGDLEKRRKLREIPPEAGKPANLTSQQAAYMLDNAIKNK